MKKKLALVLIILFPLFSQAQSTILKEKPISDSTIFVVLKLTPTQWQDLNAVINNSSVPHDQWQRFIQELQKQGVVTTIKEPTKK